jgi:hypothetical protein
MSKYKLVSNKLYGSIAKLIEQSRHILTRNINQAMVYTYYEIGRMIVEGEQQGKQRAEYGRSVLKELSKKLTSRFGKGFSERNLEQMRYFYVVYSQRQISQTASAKSSKLVIKDKILPQKFQLSWSHYIMLMRIDNVDERNFYEIESLNNNWSLRELVR